MESSQTIKKVIVIGAGGHLNPLVIKALQSLDFVVSALVRVSSKVEAPPGVVLHRSDYTHASLLDAFRGQDAVINTITMVAFEEQRYLIDIAIEAGVKRFLPAEYGLDTTKPKTIANIPYLKAKPEITAYLRSVEDKISWTGIITGPFFDWGLRNGWFFFDIPMRLAYLDQPEHSNIRLSCSTMTLVAKAVAHSLLSKNASAAINRHVHVSSFTVTQEQVLKLLQSATAAADKRQGRDVQEWKVVSVDVKEKAAEAEQKLAQGDPSGLKYMLYNAVFEAGGDFDSEGLLMNEKLGLEEEDVDEIVKQVVAEFS